MAKTSLPKRKGNTSGGLAPQNLLKTSVHERFLLSFFLILSAGTSVPIFLHRHRYSFRSWDLNILVTEAYICLQSAHFNWSGPDVPGTMSRRTTESEGMEQHYTAT